jgi:hypothetical protein
MKMSCKVWQLILLVCVAAQFASAQAPVEQGGGSFRPQCPKATLLHPGTAGSGNLTPATSEAAYNGPISRTAASDPTGQYTYSPALGFLDSGGAIKCQQISGGDGMMTEADGNQTFMFSFGPLSGLNAIVNGQPGTQFANTFDKSYCDPAHPTYNSGQPNPYFPCDPTISDPNGAVGYVTPTALNSSSSQGAGADAAAIMNTGVINGNIPAPLIAFDEDDEFFLSLTNVGMIMRPDLFEQHTVHFHGYPNASSFYDGVPDATIAINIGGTFTYYYVAPDAGTYFWHCHITPPEHLQMGMVGQLFVRPRQNRVPVGHSLWASLAGGSGLPGADAVGQQTDLRTSCHPGLPAAGQPGPDILCSVPVPPTNNGAAQGSYATADPLGRYLAGDTFKYVYNDGDGSTRYDFDVPLQIHGFDPNFHFVGMTFNPEGFSDMKDKYFLLNGRSYPDTVGIVGYCDAGSMTSCGGPPIGTTNPDPGTNAISTADTDQLSRPSQPMPSLITLSASRGPVSATCPTVPCGQRAALRIADLDVQEYQTLSSTGIPMLMVGFNAKILRDQAGNNLFIKTNSITLGGGESLDVIIDSTGVAPGTYFLYTPQLDHLSNDAENFGGLMTEVVVIP